MGSEWSKEQEWYWEGNIQAAVLRHMQEEEGFSILSSGRPGPMDQGLEIVAERPGSAGPIHRLVNVRGWPAAAYPRAPVNNQAQQRVARPEVVARGWIALAVFDAALSRGADPDLELAIALPTMASYIRYLQRLRWFLTSARLHIYLVSQNEKVTVTRPGSAPVGATPPPQQALSLRGKRRKLGLPGASRLHLPLLHVLTMAGGQASRTECVDAAAQWFPGVPRPVPSEFGQRLSIAQNSLQAEGLTQSAGRGTWQITVQGQEYHDSHWQEWLAKHQQR